MDESISLVETLTDAEESRGKGVLCAPPKLELEK